MCCCSLLQPIMISCRNLSGRHAHTWAGSIQIKSPQHRGRRVHTAQICWHVVLLSDGEIILSSTASNGFKRGEKSYVFITMWSKMTALNEQNIIELVLVCWVHIKEKKMEFGPVLSTVFLLGEDTIIGAFGKKTVAEGEVEEFHLEHRWPHRSSR